MQGYDFDFAAQRLCALGTGALWWQAEALLCVSDLHLGKSARHARRHGGLLPPYETTDTLTRLERDLEATGARQVICLGDSFDDLQAERDLDPDHRAWILRLQAGRDWTWIEGNHDPGPISLGGSHRAEWRARGLTFRHIASPEAQNEVSGHYHPKAAIRARGRTITRPCFLHDAARLILPAYGTYTGGLRSDDAVLSGLMRRDAAAILTGPTPHAFPMPRHKGAA